MNQVRSLLKKQNNAGEKGSITVEASIIIPLVILSISAALYIGMLLYQKALLQSAAEEAAGAGAAVWASGTAALESYRPDRGSDGFRLYRRIYDSGREARLREIEEYAVSLASRNELIKSESITAEATVRDHTYTGSWKSVFANTSVCRSANS